MKKCYEIAIPVYRSTENDLTTIKHFASCCVSEIFVMNIAHLSTIRAPNFKTSVQSAGLASAVYEYNTSLLRLKTLFKLVTFGISLLRCTWTKLS